MKTGSTLALSLPENNALTDARRTVLDLASIIQSSGRASLCLAGRLSVCPRCDREGLAFFASFASILIQLRQSDA